MNEDQSTKKYRGFKYLVIALLFFGAVGIYYFTKDGGQTDNTVANLKDKVSSTIDETSEQGKNLVAKATQAKDATQDKVAQGTDKLQNIGSDAVGKAEKLADSSREKTSQWDGQLTSSIDTGGETLNGVTSSDGNNEKMMASATLDTAKVETTNRLGEASVELSNRIEGAKDNMGETNHGVKASVPGMSEKSATPSDVSKALTATATETQIPDGDFETASTDQGKAKFPVFGEGGEARVRPKESMATTASSITSSSMDRDSSPDPIIAKNRQQNITDENKSASDETSGQKTSGTATANRCVGEPPKGKDMGDLYIVAYCETLGVISERTGVKVRELIDRNPEVMNPDLIYPNQNLRLPPRG